MNVLATILAAVLAQAESQSTAEPRAEFLAAVRVIQRAESYRATIDPREWFVVPRQQPGGGPRSIRLDHVRGEPLAITIEPPADAPDPGRPGRALEAWQLGERVVVRDPRGELRSFDSPLEFDLAALRDRRAPPEAPPLNEAPAVPPGPRGERDPGAAMGKLASRRVATVAQLAPHVLLAGIEGKIDGEVGRTVSDGMTTYRVAWLPEALRTLLPLGIAPRVGQGGRLGPGRPEEPIARPQGTLELDVDATGTPTAIRVTMHRDPSPVGAADAPQRESTERRLVIELRHVGTNQVTIPADVRRSFPL